MIQEYWSTSLRREVSRRRALSAAGGLSLGAAILAPCGGSSDKGTAKRQLTKPLDTTMDDKRGDVLRSVRLGDPANFEPYNSIANPATDMSYSLLVQMAPGHLEPFNGKISPDIAESW